VTAGSKWGLELGSVLRGAGDYAPPAMAECKSCGEEVDELVTVTVGGKKKKLCEDCADEVREQGEIAEASEAVVQQMMDFKGRR
jgi:hypothetical protein